MKVLIKEAQILNSPSIFHGTVQDILLADGRIIEIGNAIAHEADVTISGGQLIASAGFTDLRSFSKEPGYEAMETMESMSLAAQNGGYTDLLIMPNTLPIIQSKAAVNFFKNHSRHSQVQFHPAAAVTQDTAGENFTEMWDLHEAGARAFTDGCKPIANTDIFLKTLQYLYPKKALLINRPEEPALSIFGQMHEGYTSTVLGMKGIPSEAEELMVLRDLKLLEYAGLNHDNSLLHFSCISTSQALKLIKNAKQKGLPVSCDIAAHQLAFTDEDLLDFDTNLKVSPPFRSKKEVRALQKALEEGVIDAIVSDHNPWDEEHKNMEFDLAESGIIGLQTAFSVAWTYGGQPAETLIRCFSENPRKLLRLDIPRIEKDTEACLSIVDLAAKYTFTEEMICSKSKNSPFVGKMLKGKIRAVFNKGLTHINPLH